MKRMIIALVLLTVIICTASATSVLAEKVIDRTCETLGKCTEKGENKEADIMRLKEAISVWESNKKLVYVVICCEDFYDIEENIIKLEILSEHYDFLQISAICAETELLLRNKREDICVSFENVF